MSLQGGNEGHKVQFKNPQLYLANRPVQLLKRHPSPHVPHDIMQQRESILKSRNHSRRDANIQNHSVEEIHDRKPKVDILKTSNLRLAIREGETKILINNNFASPVGDGLYFRGQALIPKSQNIATLKFKVPVALRSKQYQEMQAVGRPIGIPMIDNRNPSEKLISK